MECVELAPAFHPAPYDSASKLDALQTLRMVALRFRAAPELQARIEELAGKSTEGQLTETERAEYAGYVRANKFIAILQRQARRLIGASA